MTEVTRLAALLDGLLEQMVQLALREKTAADRHQRLKDGMVAIFLDSLAAHGCTMPPAQVTELLTVDLELNAQGLAVWLHRDERPSAG